MKYSEESFVLDSLTELIEFIRSPDIKQLIKETHENNEMLKYIIKVLNIYIVNHNKENEEDFGRNVLANMVSNMMELNKMGKRNIQ
jgi:hypothetical protein